MIPPALDRLIRIALAKEPADRWQTMHDVALQLRFHRRRRIASRPAGAGGGAPPRRTASGWAWRWPP
jgi:hypothetical protein